MCHLIRKTKRESGREPLADLETSNDASGSLPFGNPDQVQVSPLPANSGRVTVSSRRGAGSMHDSRTEVAGLVSPNQAQPGLRRERLACLHFPIDQVIEDLRQWMRALRSVLERHVGAALDGREVERSHVGVQTLVLASNRN
jgi:hypothetical protein